MSIEAVINREVDLNPRERDVVVQVLKGYSNNDIATNLCIGVKGVERHLTNIYAAYGVSGRTQLVLRLFRDHPTLKIFNKE